MFFHASPSLFRPTPFGSGAGIRLFCLITLLLIVWMGKAAQALDLPDTGSDWFRQAAISPDAKSIAFTYKGNLYRVPAKGGTAVPMTVMTGWEGHPVWARDGKTLAFAGDRYGSLDVFILDIESGQIRRLTHHSSDDIPSDFAPDGSHILVSSVRQDAADARVGFTRAPELYAVPVTGGTPRRLLTTAANEARYNKDGSAILYRGETGYENPFRKHDTSPFARDIWQVDLKTQTHRNISNQIGGDHTPVYGAGDDIYYLSDRGGIFNVYRDRRGTQKQLTNFDLHPVRSLSRADNGTLAFSWHGGLFTLQDGKKPKLVPVSISTEPAADQALQPISGSVGNFALSPDGKEIAFVADGDVFVTSMDYATTVQITATPGEEKDVAFAPDGTALFYASERDNAWGIYKSQKADAGEKYFYRATTFTESKLDLPVDQAIQPLPSPDGKKLAFTADRLRVAVWDFEQGVLHTLSDPYTTYRTRDGGTSMTWSPDSQYLAYDISSNGRLFFTNIAVQRFDGTAPAREISLSGYTDTSPKWHSSGGAIFWMSARYGQRDHGSHGTQFDVLAGFLNQAAWNDFNLSKEDAALKEAAQEEEKDKEDTESDVDKESGADTESDAEKQPAVTIDYDLLDHFQKRLTVHSSDLADAILSKDMDKLYYLARFEDGYDLWEQDFKEDSTRKLTTLNARYGELALSPDGKTLVINAGGRLKTVALASGAAKSVAIKGMRRVDQDATRAYVYNHAWQQTKDRFYKPGDYHGADWDVIGAAYRAKLPSLGTNRDLAEVLSELLGELNASHTGGRYYGGADTETTPSIGALFHVDDTGYLAIDHIFPRGALRQADLAVAPGDRISAINGTTLSPDVNAYALLNGTQSKRLRITVLSGESARDIVIKPGSLRSESDWRYERWVQSRKSEVERLSGGRLGYVHLPSMSDRTYRRVYRDIFGQYFGAEGLVVDTRWNRGGDLMEDLIRLLTSGDFQYTRNAPLGVAAQGEPLTRWTKPTIVLMNEANYSDGHCFPAAYKNVQGGKLVGTPVTGTCTYVWWERTILQDVVFGIPTLGIFDPEGDWLENKDLSPDITVYNSPEDQAGGKDPQLEAAVSVLLKDLDSVK